jgi:hypothetical protein
MLHCIDGIVCQFDSSGAKASFQSVLMPGRERLMKCYKFNWDGPYTFSNTDAQSFMKKWSEKNKHGLYMFVINNRVHYIGISKKKKYTIFNRVMEHYHGILSGREQIFSYNLANNVIWGKALYNYPRNFNVLFNKRTLIGRIVGPAFDYLSTIKIYISTVCLIGVDGLEHESPEITTIAEKYMIYNYSPPKNGQLKRDHKGTKKAKDYNIKRIDNFRKDPFEKVTHSYHPELLLVLLNGIDSNAMRESGVRVAVESR